MIHPRGRVIHYARAVEVNTEPVSDIFGAIKSATLILQCLIPNVQLELWKDGLSGLRAKVVFIQYNYAHLDCSISIKDPGSLDRRSGAKKVSYHFVPILSVLGWNGDLPCGRAAARKMPWLKRTIYSRGDTWDQLGRWEQK